MVKKESWVDLIYLIIGATFLYGFVSIKLTSFISIFLIIILSVSNVFIANYLFDRKERDLKTTLIVDSGILLLCILECSLYLL